MRGTAPASRLIKSSPDSFQLESIDHVTTMKRTFQYMDC